MKRTDHGKEDTRPHRGAWAPGNYQRRCFECNELFIGGKRATMCADCAYAELESTDKVQDSEDRS